MHSSVPGSELVCLAADEDGFVVRLGQEGCLAGAHGGQDTPVSHHALQGGGGDSHLGRELSSPRVAIVTLPEDIRSPPRSRAARG